MMQRTVVVLVLAGCGGGAVCGEGDFSGFDCDDDASALAELEGEVAALEEENASLQDELDQVEEDVASAQQSVDVEVITVECPRESEDIDSTVTFGVSVSDDGFVSASLYSFVSEAGQALGWPEVEIQDPWTMDGGALATSCSSVDGAGEDALYTHHALAVTWLLD